ncbi:MAG TPA: hypothetical protein VGO93_07125 [Candidatus Xenobia bacterium]|jgi:hypothetical protein
MEQDSQNLIGYLQHMVATLREANESGRLTPEEQQAFGKVQQSVYDLSRLYAEINGSTMGPAVKEYMLRSLEACAGMVDGLTWLREMEFKRFRRDVLERLKKLENPPAPEQFF